MVVNGFSMNHANNGLRKKMKIIYYNFDKILNVHLNLFGLTE